MDPTISEPRGSKVVLESSETINTSSIPADLKRIDPTVTARRRSSTANHNIRRDSIDTKDSIIDWKLEYEYLLNDYDELTHEKNEVSKKYDDHFKDYEDHIDILIEKDKIINKAKDMMVSSIKSQASVISQLGLDPQPYMMNDNSVNLEDVVTTCVMLIDELSSHALKKPHDSMSSAAGSFDRIIDCLSQELNQCWPKQGQELRAYQETSSQLKRRLEQLAKMIAMYGVYLHDEYAQGYLILLKTHIYDVTSEKVIEDCAMLQQDIDKEKHISSTLISSIESLTAEVDDGRRESDRLRNMVDNLQYDLMIERAMVAEMKSAMPASPANKQSSYRDDDVQSNAIALQRERAALQKRHDDAVHGLKEAHATINTLHELLERLNKDREQQQIDAEEEKVKVQDMLMKLETTQQSYDELNEQYRILAAKYDDARRRDDDTYTNTTMREKEESYHMLVQAMNEIQHDDHHHDNSIMQHHESYQEKYEAKANECHILAAKIGGMKDDILSLHNQITSLQHDIVAITTAKDELQTHHQQVIEEMMREAKQQDDEISGRIVKLIHDVDHEKKRVQDLTSQHQIKSHEYELLRVQYDAIKAQVEDHKAREALLQQNLSAALALHASSAATPPPSSSQHDDTQLHEELDEAYKRIDDLEASLSQALEQHQVHVSQYHELQDKIKQQQKGYIMKIQKLEELLHDTHSELQQSYLLNQKYNLEIQVYKKIISDRDTHDDDRIERMKHEYKDMYDNMMMKYNTKEEEISSMKQEMMTLIGRNDMMRDCVDDVKGELISVREQYHMEIEKNRVIDEDKKKIMYDITSHQQALHRAHHELALLQGNYKAYCRINHHIEPISSTITNTKKGQYITIASNQIMIQDDVYPFDRVFESDTPLQKIFEEMEPSLTSVLYGNKVCFLSYGATTSTHKDTTTLGDQVQGSWGMVHMTLQRLYEIISHQDAAMKRSKIHISILLLDHDSDFIDLLSSSPASSANMNDPNCIVCDTIEASYDAIDNAIARRHALAYDNSSDEDGRKRLLATHLLITIHIESINIASNTKCEGSLMFVDLANSERIKPTETNAKYYRDCQSNHRALSVLRDVLSCVAKKKPKLKWQSEHIPYRNAKLTLFLQDYLQLGLTSCKIILMTHISSASNHQAEAISTLSYAKLITANT